MRRKKLKEILAKGLKKPTEKSNIRINDKFFFSMWWEERPYLSDTTDRFMKREKGIEYWLTISLWNNDEEVSLCDYSPSQYDELDGYDAMADCFIAYVNNKDYYPKGETEEIIDFTW